MSVEFKKFVCLRDECPLCASPKSKRQYLIKDPTISVVGEIVKCMGCSFIYSRSTLDDEGTRLFYRRKYSQGSYHHFSHYEQFKRLKFEQAFRKIPVLEQPAQRKHLDLGCGDGLAMEVASEFGYSSVGIDIDPEIVEQARGRGIGEVHCHSLEQLASLKENTIGSFDAITLFDILDHVGNPRAVIQFSHRHLRSGGFLYVEVTDIESFYARVTGRYCIHRVPYEHLSYFSRKTLERLLEECGFTPMGFKSVTRRVSFDYLQMTLGAADHWVAKSIRSVGSLLPTGLKKRSLSLPVGIISAIFRKD